MSLPSFSLKLSNGQNYNLTDYEDYVILIVNTATGCGLAPQFKELEKLYQKYKTQKFVILGFPSNQFKQEVTEDKEMNEVCKLNFGVTFPLNETITINGKYAHSLFEWLKKEKSGIGEIIKWNFTKFLIDRQGNVVQRFSPTTKPLSFEKKIQALL